MNAIHSAIAKRFPTPEWAVLYEVRDDAGFKARRSADVVAMNCWPSRGLRLHGMEIKTDRADWLRELRNPEKSAAIQRFCDSWWLVTDQNVAMPDEIPERWGWLRLDGKKLVVMREAPTLEPQPMTRGFLAALLRNATSGLVPESTVKEQVQEGLERAVKSRQAYETMELERANKRRNEMAAAIHAFKESSGIDLFETINPHIYPRVDATRLGAVVKQVLAGGSPFGLGELEIARRNIQNAAERVDAMIEATRGLEPKKEAAAE